MTNLMFWQILIGALLSLVAAREALAIELSCLGGETRLVNNELLGSNSGAGLEGSARILVSLPGLSSVDLGISATVQRFDVEGGAKTEDLTVSEGGTFEGEHYGTFIRIGAKAWAIRPSIRFGAFAGTYRYDLESLTTMNDAPNLETTSSTVVALATTGLDVALGLAWGEAVGIGLEYRETREIAEVRSATFTYENRVDGEPVRRDGADTGVSDELDDLVGRRYGVATRALLVGLYWRPW